MKYMGSKNRIAKYILPIMLKDRREGQYWVEPFVGGANMIDKVDGNRIGADSNLYLISTIKALQDGWLPDKKITEEQYLNIKQNKDMFKEHIVGYAGFQLSYGAMWFGSYRRDKQGLRDYSLEAYKNVKSQAPSLRDIYFECCSYNDLEIPDNSIIYCDPPYENTASYKAVDKFNHEEFWEWCRSMSSKGHKVYVSEYNAPDDFKCIWQQEVYSSLTKDTGSKKAIEKLFTYLK